MIESDTQKKLFFEFESLVSDHPYAHRLLTTAVTSECFMRVYHVLKGNNPKQFSRSSSSDLIRSMADNQAFCLRRPNHTSDMIDVFDRMLRDESMTDCALMCAEGQPVKAHRMILSASSPFFKSIFDQMSNYWPNYPIVYLKDMPITDLKAIIEFIYRGEVTICQSQLASVLKSGQSLRIKGLEDIDKSCDGSYRVTTVAKKKKKRRHRKRSNGDNTNEEPADDIDQSTDDSMTECSEEEGSHHSMADTPTDISGSRTYNESLGASEDGIEPAKLLEQSMITGDVSLTLFFAKYSKERTLNRLKRVMDSINILPHPLHIF